MDVFEPAEGVCKRQHIDINQKIRNYRGSALIGVEYIVEIYKVEDGTTRFCCTLCNEILQSNIWKHWTSFNHRLKYLQRHYPSVVKKYRPDNFVSNPSEEAKLVVKIMVEAINNFYGRLQVVCMPEHEFYSDIKKHTQDIFNSFHFDEKMGPNFIDKVETKLSELCKPKKIRVKPKGQEEIDESFNMNHKFVVNNNDNSAIEMRQRWQNYHRLLEERVMIIEEIQKEYDKSPESHPLYSDEWDMFWVRRYKQLKSENIADPKTYDYKPEWVIYWSKRMKELCKLEVEKAKKDIKLSLGLPEDAEETDDMHCRNRKPSELIRTMCDEVYPQPPRIPTRSPSPFISSDLQIPYRARSRSRSPQRPLSDREYNDRFNSASRMDYKSLENGRGNYHKNTYISSERESMELHGTNRPYRLTMDSNRDIKSKGAQEHRKDFDRNMGNGKRIYEEDYDLRRTVQNLEDDNRHSGRLERRYSRRSEEARNVNKEKAEAIIAKDPQIRTLAVIDRGVNDGGITTMNWKKLDKHLTQALVEVLKRNHGPVAQYRDAGWYQGRVKLIAFKDERSPNLYRQAIKSLGQIWPSAKLDLVQLSEVPSRPRAFAEIPANPSRPSEILELIQESNFKLPTYNWKILKVSFETAGTRQVNLTINGKSVPLLRKSDGVIRYGTKTIRLRIHQEDA